MWPEDEIGSSSAGPCSAPRTIACQTGRSSDATPGPYATAVGPPRRGPRGDPHDQIRDRRDEQGGADVVDVLEVVPPALPVASDLALPSTPSALIQMIEPIVAKIDEPQVAHPGHAGRVRERRARERDAPRHDDHRGAVALEPACARVEALLGDVQLVPVPLDQLFAAPVADRVGDRGADHVAEHAEHDDPEQAQVTLETLKPANSIVGSDPGSSDHAGGERQQRDAGETQVADDVSSQGDERIGHRCVQEQHRGLA